ncbi:MAG: hypothetical protein AAB590_01410 [Patescibacteria group bacterium]
MTVRAEVALYSAVGGGIMAILVKIAFAGNPLTGFALGMLISPLFWRPKEVLAVLKGELSQAKALITGIASGARKNNWQMVKKGTAGVGLALIGIVDFWIGYFILEWVMGLTRLPSDGSQGIAFMSSLLLAIIGLALPVFLLSETRTPERFPVWRKVSRLLASQHPKGYCPRCEEEHYMAGVDLDGILIRWTGNLVRHLYDWLKDKMPRLAFVVALAISGVLWPIVLVAFILLGFVGWAIALIALFLSVRRVMGRVIVELASHPRLSVMSGTLTGGAVALIAIGPVQAIVLWAMVVGGLTGLLVYILGEAMTPYAESW